MSDDLISREAAIKAIIDEKFVIIPQLNPLYDGLGFMSKMADYNAVCDIVVDILKKIPSAQQWIPVSERLPDIWDERYLVSLAYGGIGVMEYKSTGFHNYGSFTPVPIESIIAWMPLPSPCDGVHAVKV